MWKLYSPKLIIQNLAFKHWNVCQITFPSLIMYKLFTAKAVLSKNHLKFVSSMFFCIEIIPHLNIQTIANEIVNIRQIWKENKNWPFFLELRMSITFRRKISRISGKDIKQTLIKSKRISLNLLVKKELYEFSLEIADFNIYLFSIQVPIRFDLVGLESML